MANTNRRIDGMATSFSRGFLQRVQRLKMGSDSISPAICPGELFVHDMTISCPAWASSTVQRLWISIAGCREAVLSPTGACGSGRSSRHRC